MNVALGGTFDPVHDGHRALLRRGFGIGDVTVGLTSDDLARETRHVDRHVRPYDERAAALESELGALADRFGRAFAVRRLDEPTGIAVEPGFSHLVVSPETKPTGDRINRVRRERDLDLLDVHVVPHVRAADGGVISSTRIVAGEIDEHGNRTPEREPGHPAI
jgi:pantetheine-phosphate adenylyltransferase